MLPTGSRDAALNDDTKTLLSELEGVLQIRGAGQRVQARTVPLYRLAVADALEAGRSVNNPNAAWAELAVRQQGLALGSDRARAVLQDCYTRLPAVDPHARLPTGVYISHYKVTKKLNTNPSQEEARRIATDRLSAAVTLFAGGNEEEAMAALQAVAAYGQLVGTLLKLAASGGTLGQTPVSYPKLYHAIPCDLMRSQAIPCHISYPILPNITPDMPDPGARPTLPTRCLRCPRCPSCPRRPRRPRCPHAAHTLPTLPTRDLTRPTGL